MSLPSMRLLLCATALFGFSAAVSAQSAAKAGLKEQMSAAQFREAGLEKLSAQELATLDHWLQGTLETASASAVETGREEGRQEIKAKTRGFFDYGSNEPIIATVQGEIRNFGKGQVYTLDNGQQWEQTDTTTSPGLRTQSPKVSIRPGMMGAWYMKLDGVNAQPKVRRTK